MEQTNTIRGRGNNKNRVAELLLGEGTKGRLVPVCECARPQRPVEHGGLAACLEGERGLRHEGACVPRMLTSWGWGGEGGTSRV